MGHAVCVLQLVQISKTISIYCRGVDHGVRWFRLLDDLPQVLLLQCCRLELCPFSDDDGGDNCLHG